MSYNITITTREGEILETKKRENIFLANPQTYGDISKVLGTSGGRTLIINTEAALCIDVSS
jgi:hypothetical protein